MPQEKELKISLGGPREFSQWSDALGAPESVKEQLNMYFQSPEVLDKVSQGTMGYVLLRIRANCPSSCPQFASCDLVERARQAPDLPSATALQRNLGQRYVFTLKYNAPNQRQDGYFQSLELESELTPEQVARICRGDLTALKGTEAGDFLAAIPASTCEFLGYLRNTRRCYRRPNGELWELDCSHFPGGHEDCELEVETEDPESARREIEELAAELGTALSNQQLTKLERFLQYSQCR